MTDAIEVETDAEAADILMSLGPDPSGFGSKELRRLASNAGVSRKRGDTKRRTAERVVAQDPALVVRMIENSQWGDVDASAFVERREVGEENISLGEAERRARHDRMKRRLGRVRRAVELELPSYEATVKWEYGGDVRDGEGFRDSRGYNPGLTSIVVERGDDWDGNGLAAYRAHVLLRPTGRATTLSVGSIGGRRDYAEIYAESPRRAWRMFASELESFYDPITYDG